MRMKMKITTGDEDVKKWGKEKDWTGYGDKEDTELLRYAIVLVVGRALRFVLVTGLALDTKLALGERRLMGSVLGEDFVVVIFRWFASRGWHAMYGEQSGASAVSGGGVVVGCITRAAVVVAVPLLVFWITANGCRAEVGAAGTAELAWWEWALRLLLILP